MHIKKVAWVRSATRIEHLCLISPGSTPAKYRLKCCDPPNDVPSGRPEWAFHRFYVNCVSLRGMRTLLAWGAEQSTSNKFIEIRTNTVRK